MNMRDKHFSPSGFTQIDGIQSEIAVQAVPEDVSEMITFFNISGAMIYLDEEGKQVFYEDVFTKIEMCSKHYESVGLGADYIEQFIR